MSDYGAVPTAILAAIDAAVTLGGSQDGVLSYEKIPSDQYPFAMTHSPVKTQERGEFQHGEERTANPVLVVWNGDPIATVNAAIVLIEAQIASDPTLGGLVEDAWVAVAGRDESTEDDIVAAVLQIDTRGSV